MKPCKLSNFCLLLASMAGFAAATETVTIGGDSTPRGLPSLQPSPCMVRPTNFPKACPFDDAELTRWQQDRLHGDAILQDKAVGLLEQASGQWGEVAAATKGHYRAISLLHTGDRHFSWESYLPEVERDIRMARDFNRTGAVPAAR